MVMDSHELKSNEFKNKLEADRYSLNEKRSCIRKLRHYEHVVGSVGEELYDLEIKMWRRGRG